MAAKVNWRQAGAEVGLLFLGAVIALAVDSWVDSRAEDAAEQEHLAALHSDFVASDSIFRRYLFEVEEQQAHIRHFLDLLEGEPGSVAVDSLTASSASPSRGLRIPP